MARNDIALFDMDGTLVDFEGQMRRDLEPLRHPSEPPLPDKLWEADHGHLRARMDLVKSRPGWWRDLPPFQLGVDVVEVAKALGFEIHVLTKGPKGHPEAWAEKVHCVKANWGDDVTSIHITEDKSVHYGKVLVDDYPGYIEAWLEYRPRGQVIMPASRHHGGFRHPQVVRYDGSNLEEVRAVLSAAFDREPGDE